MYLCYKQSGRRRKTSFLQHSTSLLPISGFVLDEKFQRNASKFATFYVFENQHSFFRFSFRATLGFYLMNALVYVNIDQGIH